MNSQERRAQFESSCGQEITREPSRVRRPWRRKVWLACGEVMERFEKSVMPDVEALFEKADPGYADCFLSVVMVGMRQENAIPKIMVACINADVRNGVLRMIKDSHIPKTYPEFGFGSSSVPLHEPVPSEALSTRSYHSGYSDLGDIRFGDYDPPKESRKENHPQTSVVDSVLASDGGPSLGRRLTTSDINNKSKRSATGGIVVCINGIYYQKTVGHIDESEPAPLQPRSQQDIDYCSFDDDSDYEDDAAFQVDYDITGRGSLTPASECQSPSTSNADDSDAGSSSIADTPINLEEQPQALVDNNDTMSTTACLSPLPHDTSDNSDDLKYIGQLHYKSQGGKRLDLDYALVRLDTSFNLQKANRIRVDATTKDIQIQEPVAIPTTERDIVTVTASGGTTRGKLMPGAIYHRNPDQSSFQKLFVVRLDTAIVRGDCGADVVDEKTGNLFGHVVRGCHGTQIAYIVSAKDVFEDIQQRVGVMPVIPLSETPALSRQDAYLGSHKSDFPSSRLGVFSSSRLAVFSSSRLAVFSSSRPNGSYSSYSDSTTGSYAPPGDPHNGGVYREIDPREDRSQRFAAHVLQGPFSDFGTKKSSRRSGSSARKRGHGNGSHGSSSSSTSSRDSGYSSSSTRSQQQFQQQQPRYPGPQPEYRPAGGPGYGPAVQQQCFAPQNGQPDIWGTGETQQSGGSGSQSASIFRTDEK